MNILLITSEDNGPQLSCYGDTVVDTPHLDQLAAEGTRFERAYVTQAVCSPSRASIFTGLYPHQNGQLGLATHSFAMCRAWDNIPSLLKGAGYRTGLIGKLHVNPESLFPWDMRWNPRKYLSFQHRDVAKTAEAAGQFVSTSAGPFFLMVNYSDAHLPFLRQQCGLPEKPFGPDDVKAFPEIGVDTPRLRKHVADYYNCMSRLDTGIGMLMDELAKSGHADDTLVIYLGDHGPQFSRGKCATYEFAMRVPFIVRLPGAGQPGQVRDEMVSTIDILPTILEAAGIAASAELPGRSLLPLVNGDQPSWREHLFCEWNTSHPFPLPSPLFPQRSVRDDRHKLIVNLMSGEPNPVEQMCTGRRLVKTGTTQEEIDAASDKVRAGYATWREPPPVELYDLETDPCEFTNLAGRSEVAQVESDLRRVLETWQEETNDPFRDPAKLAQFVEEDKQVRTMDGAHRGGKYQWRYVDYLYGPA